MAIFDFMLLLALVPPPIAALWMLYRYLRYSTTDYFGTAIGVLLSMPLVLYLVGEAAFARMWAGEGNWELSAAFIVQLFMGAVGGILKKMLL